MTDAHTKIDNEVKSNDVVLFMKGTPQFPMCGFSGQVVQILNYLGVPYKGVNVLEDGDIRQGIKDVPGGRIAAALHRKGRRAQAERLSRPASSARMADELKQLVTEKTFALKLSA
jgi:monothiol glutaredoxin